jgi:ankyrin repeat protein
VSNDDALLELMRHIASHDGATVVAVLDANEDLISECLTVGATRQQSVEFFLPEIHHHIYKGDTAMHVAAAAHEGAMICALAARGGSVHAANRRGAQPLHYAVDGTRGSTRVDGDAQRDTVTALLELGADPNATDKNGTTPLLRAIRNRSAVAVAALLDGGADPTVKNKRGSTALQLASWTTGKSGSGSPSARVAQQEIMRLLRAVGEG